MWWLIAGIAFAILLIIVAVSKVRILVMYWKEGKDDSVSMSISALFGRVRFEYKVPLIALKPKLAGIRIRVSEQQSKDPEKEWSIDEIRAAIRNFKVLISYMKQYREWISESSKHVHIESLRWQLHCGLGDAPQTGVASGILWGLMGSIISAASRKVTFDCRPDLQLIPVYQDVPVFRTEVSVRAAIRVYWLFVIVSMMVWRVLKRRGGWKVWYKILIRKKTVDTPAA